MTIISVIIPVFNGEKYLRPTIESVLNQTFSDFEIIVINDGSTDKTLEVLSTIQDPRIQVLTYDNSGVSTSRNRGIEAARGDYLSFLDADDLWTPDKLQLQLKALQDQPEAAGVYSWTDYIDQEGNFLYPGSHCSKTGNIYKDLLVKNFIENGSNILIKKQVLASVGGFDPSLIHAEDWDFCLRLASHHLFTVVPQTQILYRVLPTSASGDVLKQETGSTTVLEKHSQLFQIPDNLKAQSFANLYQYLTFRCLETTTNRQGYWLATRYLLGWIYYEPKALKQRTKLILIITCKIFLAILFSPSLFKNK